MLDPRTLPTDSPPSPTEAAIVETESSGKDVATESKMNPAAISDNPKSLDNTMTYRIILSLSTAINNKDIAKRGMLYKIMFDTLPRMFGLTKLILLSALLQKVCFLNSS